MVINGSNDISVLEVQVTFDISGTNPVISLVNYSLGSNLSGLTWWFVATSPTGTQIHDGSESNPDITGSWTTFSITDAWPKPFNQIEWSGAPYILTAYVKDSAGNIYNISKNASICRPNGNTPTSKNTFGKGNVDVRVMCNEGRVYFQDQTNHSYKGLDGTQVSSTLRVIYPIDETATIPDPFAISSFSTALVPITYSSNNYQFLNNSVYDYDFGNYVHVRIKYQQLETFAVYCNVDLGALSCEIAKLIDDVENGNCTDVQEANKKLALINSKFTLVVIGTLQPLTGIDVPKLVNEIIEIGGFDCDCCNAPTGIIPQTSSVIDGYTFSINKIGGDVDGTVTTTGTNIQFNLQDVSYIVKVCENSPNDTNAFSFTSSISGDEFTKTYCLNVDMDTLAEDILTYINNSGGLMNTFNSLVKVNPEVEVIVDGDCIFQSTSTCDYDFTLENIPVNTTYALLTGITVNGTSQILSYSFNLTNLSGLQTYLNALGFGTFAVTNQSGQNVLISSVANGNNITNLTYKISSITYLADLSRACTGYVPITLNQFATYIVEYLCGITDAKVYTSQNYEICYIDPADNTKKTVTVTAGSLVSTVLEEIINRGCDTIDYITSLGSLTCASIKSLFPQSVTPLQSTDFLLGTKGDICARIFPLELGTSLLTLGASNQSFVDAFCSLVQQCGSGQSCQPYTLFNVGITTYDAYCPEIIYFQYTFSSNNLNITKVIFGNTPIVNQTITIEYKYYTSGSYILYSNSVAIGTDGIPVVSVSIPLSSGLSYAIRLSNNCSSPADSYEEIVNVPGTPESVLTFNVNHQNPLTTFQVSITYPGVFTGIADYGDGNIESFDDIGGHTFSNTYSTTGEYLVKIYFDNISNATGILASINEITEISDLSGFTSLDTLDCGQNQLTSLPNLPNSITILNCNTNNLVSLPTLPTSLLELYCQANDLTSLPTLPSSLEELSCNNNQLSALPTLPNSLLTLICSSNAITSLPALSTSLTYLNCSGNQLTSLPTLPSFVDNLSATVNNLTVTAVSNILITLDTNGLSNGTIYMPNQSPTASPNPAGNTAKTNLIGKGWAVTTD